MALWLCLKWDELPSTWCYSMLYIDAEIQISSTRSLLHLNILVLSCIYVLEIGSIGVLYCYHALLFHPRPFLSYLLQPWSWLRMQMAWWSVMNSWRDAWIWLAPPKAYTWRAWHLGKSIRRFWLIHPPYWCGPHLVFLSCTPSFIWDVLTYILYRIF